MENAKFVQELKEQVYAYMYQKFSHIVILCIGSNKIIGDCVGPMVGQNLNELLKQENKKIIIYGNMKETINFKNAQKIITDIFQMYEKPFMITIDSALGTENMIKKIVVNEGWIQIGKSLGRSISYHSHINIKGVVGENKKNPKDNIETLKKVKLEIVNELSNTVTKGIHQVIEKIGIAD